MLKIDPILSKRKSEMIPFTTRFVINMLLCGLDYLLWKTPDLILNIHTEVLVCLTGDLDFSRKSTA